MQRHETSDSSPRRKTTNTDLSMYYCIITAMEDTTNRFMSVNIPLKHRIRLWSALRWTVFVLACLFAVGYVGIIMLMPPISHLQLIYPDFLPQLGFYIHAFPGSIWLILGALQFFSVIRAKNPKAPRIMGYISMFSALLSIAGGLIIVASGKADGGRSLEIFGTFFFASWIVCLVLGWYYMRYQANIEKHREWMLRAYVITYAIVFMRPGVILFLALDPSTSQGDALAIVAPFIWTLTIVISEIHIRRARANQVDTERHYVALPTAAVSEEDGVTRVISYKRDFVRVKLVQKLEIARNTALFVFELPLKAELLTPPGHHVMLRHQSKKQVTCRPYTPVTELVRYFGRQGSTSAKLQAMNMPGTVALAIKRYPLGDMSAWLHDSVKIGDTVEMMGPSGGFYYTPNQYRSIGLVAGGTGLTPLLSLVLAVLTNQTDQTAVKLLYAASTEQDIMFHEELEQLAQQYPHKFTVKFVAGSGRITRNLLHEFLPAPSDKHLIALCGPVGFCTTVQKHLARLKYQEHMTFTFGETDY